MSTDIVRTWVRPGHVMRNHLAMGVREDRAIMFLMVACGLIFVAQLPRLSRTAHLTGDAIDKLVAYEFLAWVMIWPLGFYAIAFVSRMIAQVLGGQGTPYGARLSLFWALLASVPAALLYGLSAGFIGPSQGTTLAGVIWLGGFLLIWMICLRESEFPRSAS